LSGNDNIHNEAVYIAINITFFFKLLNLLEVLINISPSYFVTLPTML